MPYYRGKQFKVNVYTLINNHWTDAFGNQIPQNNNIEDQYLDLSLVNILNAANTTISSNALPPKCIPGFIPDTLDTQTNFITPTTQYDTNSNSISYTNDPLQFNTTFISAVPTASQNAPQSRKGTKITLSSIYITGSVTKPFIPLQSRLFSGIATQYQNDCYSRLTNNQVTFYLIYQQCRNQNEGPPKWRDILNMNGSNKCNPNNYLTTDRINAGTRTIEGQLVDGVSGWNRFTHPEFYLNVNNKEKFVIMSSMTLDLDDSNTQFNFKMYEKLKVSQPNSNSKKKYPIQTIFSNTGDNNKITNVEGGAVFLVSCCYGVYNELLKYQIGNAPDEDVDITSTGTTLKLNPGLQLNSDNNSYLDACKLYPSVSYTMKVNYYDV